MAGIFTIGRVCYKIVGRDAGKKVAVVESAKNGFAMIEGAFTKKSKCNLQHLLPTTEKIEIEESYTREQLLKNLGKGE